MAHHFAVEEYQSRLLKCRQHMQSEKIDGLLLFKQESMYYLTGFDKIGYLSFQALYVDTDGRVALLTRAPDAVQARFTSIITDIETWVDGEGVNPAIEIKRFLEQRNAGGKQLGVEYDAIGLSARRGKMLDEALNGFCHLADKSSLVDRLRIIKSPAELEYVRRSAALCDAALNEANRLSTPGTFEGDIYAGMYAAIMRRDGDPPGAGAWPMGSGESAILVRYHSGHRHIEANDQITHEFGAAYRHYHTCLMHCVITGLVDPRHRAMFAACRDALQACQENVRPGRRFGDIFDAHARSFTQAGYKGKFLNACGYSVGSTFPPSWAEEPFIYTGNPLLIEPGMVLFMHMIIQDEEHGVAMSLGETILCTALGFEQLTHAPQELVIN